MNSLISGKEPSHSGTGVFYQAIPAFGADGKNIMKLIPVQMVNGECFRTDGNKARTDSTHPDTVKSPSPPIRGLKQAALSDAPTYQFVKQQLSPANATSKRVGLDHGRSLNELLSPRTAGRSPDAVPPTPAPSCERSISEGKVNIRGKSPAPAKGRPLPTAAHAQVQTVPAWELSRVGKKPAFHFSDSESSVASNLPSVTYSSPATTMNQNSTPPTSSARGSFKFLSDTLNKAKCGSQTKGTKPHLKLIPKASQRPNSPIKWVIEDEEPLGNCGTFNTTSFGFSKVLRAVADRGTSHRGGGVAENSGHRSVVGKSGQGQENVVCNGKVFYLSKKCHGPFKMHQSDPPTSVTKSCRSNRNTAPSPREAAEPVLTETQQDVRIIIPDASDDVIDLCDEEDSTPPAAPVDEDNVIFVTYIPPKCGSENGAAAPGKETEDADGGAAPRGRSVFLDTEKNVPRVTNVQRDSNIRSLQSSSARQLESRDTAVETQSAADGSRGTSQKERDTHRMHSFPNPAACLTTLPPPKPCRMPDHVLRRMFGVTADVKIRLQRLDETSLRSVRTQAPPIKWVGSGEHRQEAASTLKDLDEICKNRNMDKSTGFTNGRRVNYPSEAADPAPLASHTRVSNEDRCHSGQNPHHGTSGGVQSAPEIGYVEPIDEDLSSADEYEVLAAARTESQTCVDVNTKTRLGRTRKRTTCPCCTPGPQGPPVKYAVRLEELDRAAWTAEQTSKKEGRTKAPGRDETRPRLGRSTV